MTKPPHPVPKGTYIDFKHRVGHAENIYQWTIQRALGLAENPDEIPRYLYHGTCKEYLPSIMKKGLKPMPGTMQAINFPVHLTRNEDEAHQYARICVEYLFHERHGYWPNKERPDDIDLDDESVVIEIDTTKTDATFKKTQEGSNEWFNTVDIIKPDAFNEIIEY
jgi:hypothetical protein